MSALVAAPLIPNGPSLFGTGIAFLVAGGLAVLLRFYTKAVNKATYGADDWLILVGYLLWVCEQSIQLTGK